MLLSLNVFHLMSAACWWLLCKEKQTAEYVILSYNTKYVHAVCLAVFIVSYLETLYLRQLLLV